MNLNGHAALSGDYNDRTRLKAVKIECFVKRSQGQCFFIISVPPMPSPATGHVDNLLPTPVSHIKPDEQNLKEGYQVNNRIFREGVHHFTSCAVLMIAARQFLQGTSSVPCSMLNSAC